MALIAKVTVAAMVDGVRRDFQPGEELPALAAHDAAALLAMNAIEDSAETAKAAKAAAAADKATSREFANARAAVIADKASGAPA